MRKITTRAELLELKRELGVRTDWHEPDEQEITATVTGHNFDNAGFWPSEEIPSMPAETQEMYVTLHRSENRQGIIVPVEAIAAVNLATLFAWATGYEGEG